MKRRHWMGIVSMGLLLYLLVAKAMAQPRGGRIGTFTYTEAQGLPTENVTDLSQLEDGSIVLKHYNSAQLYRLQATMTKLLWYGSGLKGVEATVHGSSGMGLWSSTRGLAQLRGDSLQLTHAKENIGPILHLPMNNGSMTVKEAYRNPTIWWFRKGQWINIPLPAAITDSASLVYDLQTGLPCLVSNRQRPFPDIYRFDSSSRRFQWLAKYTLPIPFWHSYVFGSDSIWVLGLQGATSINASGNLRPIPIFQPLITPSGLVPLQAGEDARIYNHALGRYWQLPFNERIAGSLPDAFYSSVYIGTYLHLRRLFPHISTYPSLYGPGNSLATHTLMQTANGDIFAASYAGFLTQLKAASQTTIPKWEHRFLPGGLGLGEQLLFFSEVPTGLFSWRPGSQPSRLGPSNETGYYLTFSADSSEILAGFGGQYRFGITPKASLSAGKPIWHWVDSAKGMRLANVVTLSEDRHGRIWFGRNSQGWGVYDRSTQKAQTWLMADNQTQFGGLSSLTDSYGHVFMGGTRGLWWADASKPGAITPAAMKRILHPLLADGTIIGAMRQWRDYLVIGAGKHILLLDLKAFQKNPAKPVLLFWHPYETNFSAAIEQNAMLIDHTDSSLWLSTSDMVYRLDLTKWLEQKRRIINPTCILIAGNDSIPLVPGKPISIRPDITSIEIAWPYQVADNFPRYVQTALVAAGDSLVWSEASFVTELVAKNRRQGSYTFYLRILQHDGSITEWQFPITIRKFLWQQGWFWLLLSALACSAVLYAYYLYKQKQLAEANAARIAAEAEALKAEQQRQLTTMQVKSLSNQFRPHFILNALNTVGAQLYDKPEVDEVLGQLGDSIGIIFKNAQQGSVAHTLAQEWQLVHSVINIKQMEYRQAVQVHIHGGDLINEHADWLLPMGILQIPVENALVHGLRNKTEGTKDLWIAIQPGDNALVVTIADNGVGRAKAATMTNHRSNGVGTANLLSIIQLLNNTNEQPITYQITDYIPEGTTQPQGTQVQVLIPKTYNYVL